MKAYYGPLSLLAATLIYALIFYLQFTQQLRVDFSSFYSTSAALTQEQKPYSIPSTSSRPKAKKLPTNLNPPFFLLLLQPLAHLDYRFALPVWTLLNFIAGLAGAAIAAKLAFQRAILQKIWPVLLLVYLSLFMTFMDTAIAQMGAFVLFFVMTGYYAYACRHDRLAGFLWGFITAIKFFPGLLLVMAWQQRRYRVAGYLLATTVVLSLLPVYYFGLSIYSEYLQMLRHVTWYGDSWNGSLYGFLYRLFVVPGHQAQSVLTIQVIYIVASLLILIWYIKKMGNNSPEVNRHYPFCLTLAITLLLSPFGWLYYFSILLLPLALTWQQLVRDRETAPIITVLWFTGFFIINLPFDYIKSVHMDSSFWHRLTIYSLHNYGLLILVYLIIRLLTRPEKLLTNTAQLDRNFVLPVLVIVAFGLLVPLSCFSIQLLKTLFSL
ncbi:glycosyltransferase family 87 protein [Legionella spiritensis]|uniref:Mannosyltransferase n=1 Tax=Legionella spiritensis TaxID=452 RepID=A0A0W0Z083_LEGSP|nr:glycosyltransferase family 87 protein [Legionella spiritensis]KTD62545.1 hypothetical protein Lspi_1757 [Legionella spiritensis]SNV30715.1 Protein of uncharacterised function (DUF2029) [Legionella spiritensis]